MFPTSRQDELTSRTGPMVGGLIGTYEYHHAKDASTSTEDTSQQQETQHPPLPAVDSVNRGQPGDQEHKEEAVKEEFFDVEEEEDNPVVTHAPLQERGEVEDQRRPVTEVFSDYWTPELVAYIYSDSTK